jgi:hypothetical protein
MKINGKNTWIFLIERNQSIKTNRITGVYHDSTRLKIEPLGETMTAVVIKASAEYRGPGPFAWDGCTPKWSILDIVVGTPDGVISPETERPKTYYGSLVHDALYQFAPRNLVTRKQADLIMLDEMTATGFFWRHVYYAFIRVFGGYWWKKHARRFTK